MKSHVQAVVIGGGVVGCSVLYHLTKAGWRDVVLVERDQLTSGSTWHAAGGFHTLNGDPNVAKLQGYTIGLYDELEKISGQSCGLHRSGGLMLADTKERMEWLKMAHARARYLGLETELMSAKEAKKLFPLLEDKYFVGAMLDAADGNLDPAGTTHAYAKSARIAGAEIYLQTRVAELKPLPDGSWDVVTEKGTIHAEHVVNCGGLWAREIGRMVGIELPVLAMEHMYLVTEDMPEVVAFNKETGHELPHAIDFQAEIYMRQEGKGMVLGTYEKACVPWQPKTTPWDFGAELLPPDLDRVAPSLEIGFQHFPAMATAGIKRVINGPFTFSPDGNPLVGPVQGLRNFWCACAVMAGFSQGGGVGLALSQWMANGDPGFDVWAMDVARFGEWATRSYTNAKVRENYSRRFSIRFPNEELPAARPQQTTSLYDLMLAQGAVMGDSWGLETPLWFAPKGEEPRDIVSFHRSNDFPHVKAECLGVRNARRRHRDRQFRQVRVHRTGRRGVPVAPHDQQDAAHRAHHPDADAEPRRQAHRRLHHRQGQRRALPDVGLEPGAEISYALVRERGARRRLGPHPSLRHEPRRPVARRAEIPRRAAEPDRCGCLERRLQVPRPPRDGHRQRAGAHQPRDLYRRSRLRDLGRARVPAPPLSGDHGGRQGARHRQFRHAGAALAAAREEFSHLVSRAPADLWAVRGGARPLRRPHQERLHRPRGGGRARRPKAARSAASRWWSTRPMPTCSATSRSGTAARSSAG